ncbi:PDIA2, partial [Symbiodinium microadriaticum]
GHSKKMEPEFEKAASSLQGNVAFGRIDASLEVEMADEFGLKSYPGIFLLHRAHWEEYTGRRHEHAMVEWLRNKVGPALEVKKSEAELQAALANRGPGAAFIARGDEKLQEAMSRVAERNRSLGSFFFLRGHGPSE